MPPHLLGIEGTLILVSPPILLPVSSPLPRLYLSEDGTDTECLTTLVQGPEVTTDLPARVEPCVHAERMPTHWSQLPDHMVEVDHFGDGAWGP